MDISPKIKNRSSIGICSTTPGYLPKGCQVNTSQSYLCISVYCCSVHNSIIMQQPRHLLTEEWIRKNNATLSVCICVYFNHKQKDIISFVGKCAQVEIIKLSQPQEDRWHVFSDLWFLNFYRDI